MNIQVAYSSSPHKQPLDILLHAILWIVWEFPG